MTGIRFPAKDGIFPFVIIRHPEDVGRKLPRNVGNYRRNYTITQTIKPQTLTYRVYVDKLTLLVRRERESQFSDFCW